MKESYQIFKLHFKQINLSNIFIRRINRIFLIYRIFILDIVTRKIMALFILDIITHEATKLFILYMFTY